MTKRSREDPPPSGDIDSTYLSPSPSNGGSYIPLDESRSTKYLQVSDEPTGRNTVAMKCSLAPHSDTITFTTFEDFEVHYAQIHTNRCSECQKNFPTEHFLSLHISENHDPLVEARRAREEKTYRCFVEDCDKICSTPHKRRMHLQAKHFFPKDYDFFIVNDGIDKRSSMLRTKHRRGSSAASRAVHRGPKHGNATNKPPCSKVGVHDEGSLGSGVQLASPQISTTMDPVEESSTSPSKDMDELASTMSALKFVPPSVRLGRGGRAAGLARH
ncbi:MAG: hypothetical protein Q9211_004495 [Gyalolechia sp. 1 TL-2023]